jgi:hypothetical protein
MTINGRRYDAFNTVLVYCLWPLLIAALFVMGNWFIGTAGIVAFVLMICTFQSVPTPFNWPRG